MSITEQSLTSKIFNGILIGMQFILCGFMVGYVLLGFFTPGC